MSLSRIWTHDHWIPWIPFRRSIWLSYQAMSSTRTQSQLCTATPISSFVQFPISFQLLPSSVPAFNLVEISWSNQMSIAEWAYVYGIHHRRVIWSSYRKLTLVGFEPTTTGTLKNKFSVCDVKEFVDYYNRLRKANFSERIYIYIDHKQLTLLQDMLKYAS